MAFPKKNYFQRRTKPRGPKANERIRALQVQVISSDGKNLGTLSTQEAISIAKQEGLDLIEISPNANPPVCKIIDYGKYRYEQQRQKKLNKKKQHIIHVKEIRVRPNIGQHDLVTKLKKGQKFLLNGDKLKITVMFRGREMHRMDDGINILKEVIEGLGDISKVDKEPSKEGRRISVVLSPI